MCTILCIMMQSATFSPWPVHAAYLYRFLAFVLLVTEPRVCLESVPLIAQVCIRTKGSVCLSFITDTIVPSHDKHILEMNCDKQPTASKGKKKEFGKLRVSIPSFAHIRHDPRTLWPCLTSSVA